MLKNSPRNCTFQRSLIEKFLNNPISQLNIPEPTSAPLPTFPALPVGGNPKAAGFTQRGVFGEDLISLRWAKGAFGIVDNLTKNFFALLSFQWWRTLGSIFAVAFLNLGPFFGVWMAHGWARFPYAVALVSIFLIYCGMSSLSAVRPYYLLLHPVSTSLFMYILLRSMVHTLWNDGVIWRGTKYPLDELRKGLV